MRMNRRILVGFIGMGALIAACGGNGSTREARPDSSPSATPPPQTSDTTPVGSAASSSTSTSTGPVAGDGGTALGPRADVALAQGPPSHGPLPGQLPFASYATTGAAHFTDGSWAWTVGWSWIAANKGTLPDGAQAGYDWSLNVSSVPAGAAVTVPGSASSLMTTSAFDFHVQNSSCEFGEGTATSTSVWVLADGVVVAVGTVSETVADCAWDARTMSPAELVDVLASLTDCSFGDGQVPTCTPVEPITADTRAAAAALLGTPGI